MYEASPEPGGAESAEASLCRDLARSDRVITSVAPVLRHLLAHDDKSLFADDIVARIRGMLDDLARQLADLSGEAETELTAVRSALATALPDVSGLLRHLHALALEYQASERMAQRLELDAVLSPLLQALIASSDGETGAAAMKLLAAQARFVQCQRRMQLPLTEMPGELLHGVLTCLHETLANHAAAEPTAAEAGVARLKASYDEAATRLGLIARQVGAMGSGALAALDLPHAGVAIFTSALAQAHGQAGTHMREFSVLCLQDGQSLRLALALRAAGVKRSVVEGNLLALHPDVPIAEAVFKVSGERAIALLNQGVA